MQPAQAGRLVAEAGHGSESTYSYDVAGQLRVVRMAAGEETEYVYDGQGGRTRKITDDAITEYGWDERGWLTAVATQPAVDGAGLVQRTTLWVNALGELAEADALLIGWDSAAYAPEPVSIGGTSLFRAPGALTGIGGAWVGGGWRGTRESVPEDPWQTLYEVGGVASAPGALSVTVGAR